MLSSSTLRSRVCESALMRMSFLLMLKPVTLMSSSLSAVVASTE